MITTWYFVLLVAVGDHWALDPLRYPEPYATLQECMDASNFLMIDSRDKRFSLNCIEADDEFDLHKIILENFRMPGRDS